MNRAQVIARIMSTYEPGQKWQYRQRKSDSEHGWTDCMFGFAWEEPSWDWYNTDYRRKPEPALRPVRTIEEATKFIGKVAVRDGQVGLISSAKQVGAGSVMMTVAGNYYSAEYAFANYKLADGGKIGVQETEGV